MKPIGLTMKKSRNKYRLGSGGELMLVHECNECGSLSINRSAADDDPEAIMGAFNDSLLSGYPMRARCEQAGIALLNAEDVELIFAQLYGQEVSSNGLIGT
jgi:RNHCP domain-containing protein